MFQSNKTLYKRQKPSLGAFTAYEFSFSNKSLMEDSIILHETIVLNKLNKANKRNN